ncbi:MAG: hypothetical protein ACR2PT_21845 [Endozoicomonas sp.]
MSKGFILSLVSSALLGSLIILPLWLGDFSAAEIVFGRYLVFGGLVLMIFLFRQDTAGRLKAGDHRRYLLIALLGNLGYYLFLSIGIRELGGLAGCLLLTVLPVLSWRIFNSGWNAGRSVTTWPLLILFLAGLLLVLNNESDVANSSKEEVVFGAFWLIMAGVFWLSAARIQARLIWSNPETDSSDYFLLSGLASLLALLLMLPLMLVGQGEFSLFSEHRNANHWETYWLSMLYAGVAATLAARLLWRRAVLNSPGERIHGYTVLESFFGMIYLFSLEKRWPEESEWVFIVLWLFGWLLFYHCSLVSRVLKA